MAKIKKLDLRALGIRAGSVEADLARKINEIIELYESQTGPQSVEIQKDGNVVVSEGQTVKFPNSQGS